MTAPKPSYDCIIVGAGIAGLYCARELSKQNPSWSIAIAERYKGLGGRTYSYSPPGFKDIHWEMGAGRIHKKYHPMVMRLLKKYDLTWVPIGDTITYKNSAKEEPIPNPFESTFIPIFIQPLLKLEKSVLANHTIKELLEKIYGSQLTDAILQTYPYWAETKLMRADLSLATFIGGEMESHSGYGIVKEGFSELVARMKQDLINRGCSILNRHKLVGFNSVSHSKETDCTFEFGYDKPGEPHGTIVLRATKAVVLALHKDAVSELNEFDNWHILSHLKTQPLLRTYAIFDTKHHKPVWFSKYDRIVTPERPRYILPMNPKQGTIMISYTDGEDTKEYIKIQEKEGDKALEKIIMSDIRKLFPNDKIPNPLFFKSHPWKTGATYWLPGNYNPEELSKEAIHPFPTKYPGVWLCGESWSLKQAWVEGALEHASLCLARMKA